jgi:hypothetical protein
MSVKNFDTDGGGKRPAKRQVNQPVKKQWSPGQNTFVNYDLTLNEREQCKAWQLTLEELDNLMLGMVESGYNITLNYDVRNQAYGCFIKVRSDENVNAGLILTGRGSTPLKAFKQAYYKHTTVFDGTWGSYDVLNNNGLDD